MEIKICQISVRDLNEWLSTGWADWAGSVGFGWTWPLDPKTKVCWATPELLPCLCMTLLWCCQLLQVLSCLSKGLGTLLKPERLL